MLITLDTPVLRLIDGPQWTVLFWRMSLVALTLITWWLVMHLVKKTPPPLVNGKSGIAVSLLYSVGNVSFLAALYNTNVANVVFILALTPLVSAVISFVWLKEKPAKVTWIAMLAALCGVAVIVWSDLSKGSLLGNGLAFITAAAMAMAFAISRRSGKNLAMAPVLAGLITAIIAFFIGADFNLTSEQWFWLFINGVIIMPLSLSLLILGPKYISAPEVALFLLLETILAPIWVWLAVGEQTPPMTIVGGTIVLATLIAHSAYKLRNNRTQK